MTAGTVAGRRDGGPAATAVGATGRSTRHAIAFDRIGGDAWTWKKRLSGTCAGVPPDSAIALEVDGRAFPASCTGDSFAGDVRFAPGANTVVAVALLPDGTRAVSEPVVYDIRLRPRPTARLIVLVEGERLVFDASGSEASDYDGSPVVSWSVTARPGNPVPMDVAAIGSDLFSAALPTTSGEYLVELLVADAAGRTDAAAARFVVDDNGARLPNPLHERASWIASAVVYGVVPRNFEPPGFAGLASRLDDLRDLGVSALWFSPITRTPDGRFGYEVTDYFATNPAYGTVDEFRDLVEQAHARGLRVLLDVVPNHTSAEHPYFKDTVVNGEASAYWDFYDRGEHGEPTHYFDWTHLPSLNFDHPEVRRFTREALVHWVRDLGVDGFRIDAVWGVKERNPAWLAELLAEVRRIKPDALVIAEASARDGDWFDLGFDAAYDWTDDLGKWAWEGVFGGGEPIDAAMVRALAGGGDGYHPEALVLRFLNNNDTGDRFLTTHGVGCYRVALTMLLTLPGLPCLFTGDEVGAEFRPYETAGPIDWRDCHGLRPFVKRLIALRRGHPALHSRTWTPLAVESAAPCFAYLREGDSGEAAPAVVVLNFSGDDAGAKVPLPPALCERWSDAALHDVLDGDASPASVRGERAQQPSQSPSRARRGISSQEEGSGDAPNVRSDDEIPRRARHDGVAEDAGRAELGAVEGGALVVSVPAWGARIMGDVHG